MSAMMRSLYVGDAELDHGRAAQVAKVKVPVIQAPPLFGAVERGCKPVRRPGPSLGGVGEYGCRSLGMGQARRGGLRRAG